MVPKENRLVRGKDFERIYRKGRRVSSPNSLVSFQKTRMTISRVAVVAGKKLSKKATIRNRAKRIYREALRSSFEKIIPGYDIIVYIRVFPDSLEKTKKEILEIFKRGGLLK